jgi:hypothetical protein
MLLFSAMENRIETGFYTGNHSVTEGGYTCQRWDSQYPHAHNYSDGYLFREMNITKVSNFCRDPDGYFVNLWCYTTNSSVEVDMCYLNGLYFNHHKHISLKINYDFKPRIPFLLSIATPHFSVCVCVRACVRACRCVRACVCVCVCVLVVLVFYADFQI